MQGSPMEIIIVGRRVELAPALAEAFSTTRFSVSRWE
jgi:hypothetical protein